MKAYYFTTKERKLQYNDNRPIVISETHSVEGKIRTCSNGLHASTKILDALSYAPGSILYLVELSGEMNEASDKVAAQHRKYLQEFDATGLLKKFARMQALINIEKIKPYCSIEDYELINKWLESGIETLRSAAWSAAWSAARSAAESAAESAARSAWSAAESAAESAAWSAARSAAESAAESAARSARSARSAWSAARSTAESAANEMLLNLLENETKLSWRVR